MVIFCMHDGPPGHDIAVWTLVAGGDRVCCFQASDWSAAILLTLSLVETAKREVIVMIFRLCRLFDHSVKIIIHLMMNLKLTILVLGFAPLHGRFDVFQNMKSWQSSQQKWLIFWRLIFTKMMYFSMNNVKYYLISSADIYTCTTINLIWNRVI